VATRRAPTRAGGDVSGRASRSELWSARGYDAVVLATTCTTWPPATSDQAASTGRGTGLALPIDGPGRWV
jgi:hypothetical protein